METLERRLVGIIGWITVATGATQVLVPGYLLPLLGVEYSSASMQLFATVGMFMVVIGGMTVHALRHPGALPVVLTWTGAQKVLAALFVAVGVWRGVFFPLALAVAGFDFLSSLIVFDLRRRIRIRAP